LDKYAPSDSPPPTISKKAGELLQTYDFPGNVRELKEAIQVAITKARSGIIEPEHLPGQIQNWQRSTKLAEVIRGPLPENIVCPHGYALSGQADAIAQTFDTQNYVYLSVRADTPVWYQPALEDILAQFGLKLYDSTDFSSGENFCPICQPVLASHLAILDISDSNPAIFYELGLAQAIGLPCAILKEKGNPVPAELGGLGLLEYYDKASLKKSILSWLSQLAG
jgi:hypothetical protein